MTEQQGNYEQSCYPWDCPERRRCWPEGTSAPDDDTDVEGDVADAADDD